MEQQPKDDAMDMELFALTEDTAKRLTDIADRYSLTPQGAVSAFTIGLAGYYMLKEQPVEMITAMDEGSKIAPNEIREQVLQMTKEWLERPDDAK